MTVDGRVEMTMLMMMWGFKIHGQGEGRMFWKTESISWGGKVRIWCEEN